MKSKLSTLDALSMFQLSFSTTKSPTHTHAHTQTCWLS